MLKDHTASKGALMMTSCLDRNGGGKSCLQIVDDFLLKSRERDQFGPHKSSSTIITQPSRTIRKILSLKIRGGQPACGTSAPAPVGTLRKPQQRLQQRIIHIRHLFPRSHSRARGIAVSLFLRRYRHEGSGPTRSQLIYSDGF